MNCIRSLIALLAFANVASSFVTSPTKPSIAAAFGLNKNGGFLSMSAVAEAPPTEETQTAGMADKIR